MAETVEGAVESYESHTAKRKKRIEEEAAAAKTAAEAAKSAAITAAGEERLATEELAAQNLEQRESDISAAYKRAQVGYGRQAESLAQAGMTGAGYADNLTRDAYAAAQSSRDAAKKAYGDTLVAAQRAESQAVADANAAYQSAVTAADAAKRAGDAAVDDEIAAAYNDILLNAGNMTFDQIDALTKKYDFASAYGADFDAAKLKKASLEAQGVTTASIAEDARSGSEDFAATLAKAEQAGLIDTKAAESYKAQWAKAYDDTLGDLTALSQMDEATARAALAMYEASGLADETTLTKYKENVDDTFSYATAEGKFVYTGDKDLSNDGKDFKVRVGDNTYRLESAGEVFNDNVLAIAKKLENGTLFYHNGNVYVAKKSADGTTHAYRAKKRNNRRADDWKSLVSQLQSAMANKYPERYTTK